MIVLTTKYKSKIDVKSVFLNWELKEEVYLVHPKGFVKKGQEHLDCKLKKDLYGLKQEPRSSYVKIGSFIHKFYMKSKSDPNLYTNLDQKENFIMLS